MMRYFALIAPALLAGCVSALSAPPAGTSHTLTAPAGPSVPLAVDGPAVQVPETSAAPGYTTSAMVYRRAPHTLQSFATHRWTDQPARLITEALRAGLDANGLLVLKPGAGIRPDYRLSSELVALEQDFTVSPSRMVLAVRLQLIDVRTRRAVGARSLRLETPATSDDAPGGVAAAQVLVARLVEAAHTLVRGAVDHSPSR